MNTRTTAGAYSGRRIFLRTCAAAALVVRVRGAGHCANGISEQTDPPPRRLRTRRWHRHRRPRVGRQDVGGSRSDDRRRKSCRRVGHDRRSRSRAFCPRWLHAVNGSFELECDRAVRVGQSSVRRSGGLHADYVRRLRAQRARGSSEHSRAYGSRTGGAREGQARHLHVCIVGGRQHAASGRRAVRKTDRRAAESHSVQGQRPGRRRSDRRAGQHELRHDAAGARAHQVGQAARARDLDAAAVVAVARRADVHRSRHQRLRGHQLVLGDGAEGLAGRRGQQDRRRGEESDGRSEPSTPAWLRKACSSAARPRRRSFRTSSRPSSPSIRSWSRN